MSNLIKAILVINAAKKGWSDAARAKAAAKRKRKSSVKPVELKFKVVGGRHIAQLGRHTVSVQGQNGKHTVSVTSPEKYGMKSKQIKGLTGVLFSSHESAMKAVSASGKALKRLKRRDIDRLVNENLKKPNTSTFAFGANYPESRRRQDYPGYGAQGSYID